jgi:hypothetical protein
MTTPEIISLLSKGHSPMTAVAEIESGIEKLSPTEVKELAAWLDEYQQMINASAELFSLYDQEEGAKS